MTSAKSAKPGARKRYGATSSRRRRAPVLGRRAEALRPRTAWRRLLEKAVNLLGGVGERVLDRLLALERLRHLGLQDGVDLRVLRRRRARLRRRDLLQVR